MNCNVHYKNRTYKNRTYKNRTLTELLQTQKHIEKKIKEVRGMFLDDYKKRLTKVKKEIVKRKKVKLKK